VSIIFKLVSPHDATGIPFLQSGYVHALVGIISAVAISAHVALKVNAHVCFAFCSDVAADVGWVMTCEGVLSSVVSSCVAHV